MAIKFLLTIAAAAVGGIYLTSEEGKKTREAIKKKRSTFDPIIKSLLSDTSKLIEGSEDVSIEKVRANIRKLSLEARKILSNIDVENTIETIKEAIKVATNKINDANNELNKPKKTPKRVAKTKTKTKK